MKATRLESALKDVAEVPEGDPDCARWAEEACEGFALSALFNAPPMA